MGFFGKLKKAVNIATLGQLTFVEKHIELGGKMVKVVIDVNNEVVRIGEEVFRAAPGEVFFPGIGPLAGLLKNEVEDELILLNPLGIVPSINVFFGVDPVGAVIVVGDLLGVVQHRAMFDDELALAQYVFRGSLRHMDQIRLTNLVGLDGNPFAAPTHAGGGIVNLGNYYVHDSSIANVPLLIHELTHIWQIERSILTEVAVCKGLLTAAKDELGEDVYSFEPGSQWSRYGIEQQASILEAWSRGATRRSPTINGRFDVGARTAFTIGSPVFRYINGNIRCSDAKARTSNGRSIKRLLAEGAHETVRAMHPPAPRVWWPLNIGL